MEIAAGREGKAGELVRALVRVTFLYPEVEWYSTSVLYRQYCWCLKKEVRPLGYRRVSEFLGELENQGLAISRAVSKGRQGYGRQYRLTVAPDVIGACFPEWWEKLKEYRFNHEFKVNGLAAQASDLDLPAEERHDSRVALANTKRLWQMSLEF